MLRNKAFLWKLDAILYIFIPVKHVDLSLENLDSLERT